MHLRIALATSALTHFVLFGGLWFWVPDGHRRKVGLAVVHGEAITLVVHSPGRAQPTPIELSITKDATLDARDRAAQVFRSIDPPLIDPVERSVERPSRLLPLRDPLESAPSTDVLLAQRRPDEPSPPSEDQQTAAVALQTTSVAGAEVDQIPRKLPQNPPPNYPRDALAADAEGRVLIRVLVRADGSVERAAIATSSGHASLDQAALVAVRRWRFEPARRGNQAVSFEVIVPIKFSINRG